MKKSKYAIDPIALMKMTDSELRSYIRSASKVFDKRIKAFQVIPYGKASETLSYIESSGNTFKSGKSMFATKGLTRSELQAKAMGVNVIATLNETPAQFVKDAEDEIKDVIYDYSPDDEEAIEDMFYNPDNFEKLRDFINVHIDSIYDLLGSDRVNEFANTYEDDDTAFYAELLKETISEFQNVERTERKKFFKEKRKKKRKK